MGAAERLEPVLLGVAAQCLRVAPSSIDPHAPLARYGLDSLSALELCVALSEATGLDVGEDDLLDAPSVHALAQRLEAVAHPCSRLDRRVERMIADTRLPADIDPRGARPVAGGACLLTGATGFLGVHLLAALIAAGKATIICPVRARDDRHARSRIDATMQRYGVSIPDVGNRVRAIGSDLNDPQLGRWAADYERLAREVGSVVHCAADVNWALSYEGLRGANVLVTQNLLRFASRGARKRFHFISSLAACYSTRARSAPAEMDAAPDPAGLHLGYAQSKWVAERLVEAAADRGLDATLYRPSLVTSHSDSGIGNDDDLFAQLVRGVIALGHAPDLDWHLDGCPVDYVAQAIARLAHLPNQGLAALHLRNPRPARWSEAVLWMNVRGYQVSLEPFAAWIERAERASRDPGHVLHRLRGFLFARAEGSERMLPEIYADHAIARVDAERSDALVARLGLSCPRLDVRALERTFDAWVAHGALPDAALERPRRRSAPALADAQIERQLQQHLADPRLRIVASRRRDFGGETSILGSLASWHVGAAVALHARSVDVVGARPFTLDIVVKPRYGDAIVRTVATRVARSCGAELGAAFDAHYAATGLAGNAQRELAVYARATGALREILPQCYGVIDLEGVRALLLERVGGDGNIEQGDRAHAWSRATIDTALAAIGRVHGEWLERPRAVETLLGGRFDVTGAIDAQPLWRALSAYAQPRLRAWIGAAGARLQSDLGQAAPAWLSAQASHPRTLIHNDLNPRNFIAGQETRFCAFDWELAELGLPQRDAIEMLCFVMAPDANASGIRRRIERHRTVTQSVAGIAVNAAQWDDGVRLALADYGVRRLPMYFMADRFRPQGFLERVTRAWWRLAQVFALHQLVG